MSGLSSLPALLPCSSAALASYAAPWHGCEPPDLRLAAHRSALHVCRCSVVPAMNQWSAEESSKRSRFYRWWPAIATVFAGLFIATGLGSMVGAQFHDHDTGVMMAFFVSMLAGILAGQSVVLVWWRRNPW